MSKDVKQAEVKEEPKFEFPAGFEEAAPKKLWAVVEEGTIIQGIVLDTEKRKRANDDGNFSDILFMRCTVPHNLKLVKGSDTTDDREEFEAQVGDEFCLDAKARLSILVELAQDVENTWEAYILAVGKVKLEGGKKSMWNFKVGKQLAKPKDRIIKKGVDFDKKNGKRDSHPNAPGNR